MASYYEVLGVSQHADSDEIKRAFKSLALRWHPDKNRHNPTQAEEKFKEINLAYQTLSDPVKKARYDSILAYNAYQKTTYERPSYQATQQRYNQYQTTNTQQSPYRKTSTERISWRTSLTKPQFILVFVIAAIIIYGTVAWAEWIIYEEKENARIENEKRRIELLAIKTSVKERYQAQKYTEAIELLNNIDYDKQGIDIFNFNLKYLENTKKIADQYFNNQEYAKASEIYQAIRSNHYSPYKDIIYNLALCERKTGDPELALLLLSEMAQKADANLVLCYTEIGNIYADDYNDNEAAITYYDKACDIAFNIYKRRYGNNFYYVMDASGLPDFHYNAFYNAGINALDMELYTDAQKYLTWAQRIRPTNKEPLLQLIKTFAALGDNQKVAQTKDLLNNLIAEN